MAHEYYRPQPMAANSSYHVATSHMAGFLATVAGTITVTARNPADDSTLVVVNALPVAVGFNRIPLMFQTSEGADIQLAGGAAGSLLI
jgi:hypothetical protein